jgi:hypothetical protein
MLMIDNKELMQSVKDLTITRDAPFEFGGYDDGRC